jgi:nicotinamide-nucleotide amidase
MHSSSSSFYSPLHTHSLGAARALVSANATVATVEATSGGLISASLQAIPGSSRFFLGGVIIYSAPAAKALLPAALLFQLGTPQQNYSSGSNYLTSKRVFTTLLAQHWRERMGADWAVAESGAADASASGRMAQVLREEAGAFTVVAVAGPGGVVRSLTQRAAAGASREDNMRAFAKAGLDLLQACVERWSKAHADESEEAAEKEGEEGDEEEEDGGDDEKEGEGHEAAGEQGGDHEDGQQQKGNYASGEGRARGGSAAAGTSRL